LIGHAVLPLFNEEDLFRFEQYSPFLNVSSSSSGGPSANPVESSSTSTTLTPQSGFPSYKTYANALSFESTDRFSSDSGLAVMSKLVPDYLTVALKPESAKNLFLSDAKPIFTLRTRLVSNVISKNSRIRECFKASNLNYENDEGLIKTDFLALRENVVLDPSKPLSTPISTREKMDAMFLAFPRLRPIPFVQPTINNYLLGSCSFNLENYQDHYNALYEYMLSVFFTPSSFPIKGTYPVPPLSSFCNYKSLLLLPQPPLLNRNDSLTGSNFKSKGKVFLTDKLPLDPDYAVFFPQTMNMLLRKFIRNSLLPKDVSGSEDHFDFQQPTAYESIYSKEHPSNFIESDEGETFDDEYSYGVIEKKYYDYVYYMRGNSRSILKRPSCNNKMNIYRDLLYVLRAVNAIFKEKEKMNVKIEKKEMEIMKKEVLKPLQNKSNSFSMSETNQTNVGDPCEQPDDGNEGNVYDEFDEVIDYDDRNQSQRIHIMCVFLDHLFVPDERDIHLFNNSEEKFIQQETYLTYPRCHTSLTRKDYNNIGNNNAVCTFDVESDLGTFLARTLAFKTNGELCGGDPKSKNDSRSKLEFSYNPYEYHEIHYILLQCMSLQLLKVVFHHIFIVAYEMLKKNRDKPVHLKRVKNIEGFEQIAFNYEYKFRKEIIKMVEDMIDYFEWCDYDAQENPSIKKEHIMTFSNQLKNHKNLLEPLMTLIRLWWRCSQLIEVKKKFFFFIFLICLILLSVLRQTIISMREDI
jgi:hypothetical protein